MNTRRRDVRRDGVSVEETLSELSSSGARKRIAIVDASRRNPYERRFREYSHGLAPIGEDENSIVITSTSPEQVAEDAGTLPNRFVNGLAAKISPRPFRSKRFSRRERQRPREIGASKRILECPRHRT
jgi:hypothetical protein